MNQSPKVVLRELRRSDVDDMTRWQKYTEPQFQWANFDPHSEWEKDLWYSAGRAPGNRRFAILNSEGRLVGVVALRNINAKTGEGTLGVRMSAGEVNKGLGTAAITALLDHAFTEMGLNRVNLDVVESNLRARRCYEKCGFQIVGYRTGNDGTSLIDMTITKAQFYQHASRSSRQTSAGRSA